MTGRILTCAAIAAIQLASSSASADPTRRRYRGDPECIGASPVVGRSPCAWYGREWALPEGPRMQLSLGLDMRRLGSPGIAIDDDDGSGVAASQTAPSVSQVNGGGIADAAAFDLRITGEVTRALYIGTDTSIGTLHVEQPTPRDVRIEEGGLFFSTGGVAGLVLHLGPFVARGEMFGGVRVVELPLTLVTSSVEQRSRASEVGAMLEPRVAAELWLAPWITLGVHAGSDLLRENDLLLGVYLGLYGHGYDASRRR